MTAIDIVKKNEDGSMDFDVNMLRLERIVNLCSENSTNIILITMPLTSHYAENVSQVKLKKVIASCNYFKEKKDNVSYLNLFQNSQFDNTDFYDTDHLNTKGTEKCSKILNQLILDLK